MAQLVLPEPGDIVGGKYRIERALGRGGMGAVFEASHRVTHKRFAIKLLMVEAEDNEVAVTRFVREAQVAGRCEHPNIVEVYDIDREGHSFFMIMELLQGESLAERIARSGRLSTRDALRLLLPCMEAIGEAHGAGIIHRDLKPANIFVCRERVREPELAKVLDFGVSRFAAVPDALEGTSTRSGAVVGTPFYMAPEQMRGQLIDTRVDVYSMGVTMYEVLAGMRPYHAESYGDLLLKIAGSLPTSLLELVPDLPEGLAEVIGRAMAYDRASRFASMQAFMHALMPFRDAEHRLDVHSVAFERTSQLTNTPLVAETPAYDFIEHEPPPRPRPVKWIALGLSAALLLTAALVWRAYQQDAPSSTPTAASVSHTVETPRPVAPSSPPTAAPPAATDNTAEVPTGLEPPDLPVDRRARANGRAGRRGRAEHLEEAAPAKGRATDTKPKRAKSRAPAILDRSDF
jgi:serine/threonine protein kinase